MRSAHLKKTVLLSIAILLGAGLWCCWYFARGAKISNVLIISMDTTRSDYLSCYGYPQKTTPNIDALAREGTLFANALSPIPLTLPAHSTMMTGTIPPYHGVHDNAEMKLADSNLTLAEKLSEHGFKTHAIVSAMVLGKEFGLDQGFGTYDDQIDKSGEKVNIPHRKGGQITELALAWLEENRDEKFFLFLHYYDPHYPYAAPEPFASKFKDVPNPGNVSSRILKNRGGYAGEIAYTDHCIGQVIDKLKETGLYDSTLIVITGDHGEMLFAKEEPTHGYFIYQEALKVPLILRTPGAHTPKRVKSIAGIVDIMPTICSLLGIAMPSEIHGQDLSPYIDGSDTTTGDRAIFCESLLPTKYNANSLLGIVTDRYKYIQTTNPELYDLVNDPYEHKNLINDHSQRAKLLQDRLRQILENSVSTASESDKLALDDETSETLKSLGYVGGTVDIDFSFDQDKDEPKELIVFHNEVAVLQEIVFFEEYDEAEELCKKLIKQRPGISVTQFYMADILLKKKEYKRAIPFLVRTVEFEPENFNAYKKLGDAYKKEKEYGKAAEAYHEVLKLKGDLDFVFYNLAQVYDSMGEPDLVLKYCKETIRVNPEHINARVSLAGVYLHEKKIALVLEQYLKLVELKPESVSYNNSVGWLMSTASDDSLRDPEEAIKYALMACQLSDNKIAGTFDTLAVAYASAGKFDKAVDAAKRAIKLAISEGKVNKITAFKKRLELYRSGQAYYE